MEKLHIDQIKKKIKLLKQINNYYLLLYIFSIFTRKLSFILPVGIVGILLQIVIYFAYRKMGETQTFINGKAKALAISMLLIILIILSQYFWA